MFRNGLCIKLSQEHKILLISNGKDIYRELLQIQDNKIFKIIEK